MKDKLPKRIRVKFLVENGIFIAELPEYNLHTEADSMWELVVNVNDLIKLFFDIPSDCKINFYPPTTSSPPPKRVSASVDFYRYMLNEKGNYIGC